MEIVSVLLSVYIYKKSGSPESIASSSGNWSRVSDSETALRIRIHKLSRKGIT